MKQTTRAVSRDLPVWWFCVALALSGVGIALLAAQGG